MCSDESFEDFDFSVLAIFGTVYTALTCIVFGLSVPSGVFIPALLSGAAFGTICSIHQSGVALGRECLSAIVFLPRLCVTYCLRRETFWPKFRSCQHWRGATSECRHVCNSWSCSNAWGRDANGNFVDCDLGRGNGKHSNHLACDGRLGNSSIRGQPFQRRALRHVRVSCSRFFWN